MIRNSYTFRVMRMTVTMLFLAMFATTTAWAAVLIDGVYYNLDESTRTAEITDTKAYFSEGDVVLPAQVTYNSKTYRVTSIGGSAFEDCNEMTSLVIPEGVTYIGGLWVFGKNSSLTSITFPESLISTDNVNGIFNGHSLYRKNFNGLVYYGKLAAGFWKEGMPLIDEERALITSIELRPDTKGIGDFAFYGLANLTSITIPESMEYIGYSVFDGCSSLTTINLPDNIKYIDPDAFKNTAWWDAQPDGEVYLGNWLLGFKGQAPDNYCLNVRPGTVGIAAIAPNTSVIIIPESVKYFNVEMSADQVFCYANPDEVSYMYHGFDKYSSLYGNNVLKSNAAFHVTDASKWTRFSEHGLTVDNMSDIIHGTCGAPGHEEEITWDYDPLSQTITIAGTGDMMDDPCNIDRDLSNPQRWHNIRLGIKKVIIGNGITSIGEMAFYLCHNITEIDVSASVKSISLYGLGYQPMPWIDNQPDGVVYAGLVAYCYKGDISNKAEKTAIILKEGTKGIAHSAFGDCYNIVSLTIPASVTHIDEDAFLGTENVTDVYCYADPEKLIYKQLWGDPLYFKSDETTRFHVHAEYLPTYQAKWNKENDPDNTNFHVIFAGDLPRPIKTAQDWDALASRIINGTFENEANYYRLESDISVTTMLGTGDYPFKGTFDGCGHTLTVNLEQPGVQYTAPFSVIQDANISNLTVEGSISGNRHSSGLVGGTGGGTNVIENCVINTSLSCQDYAGGIVGHGGSSANYTLRGCVFNGSFGNTSGRVGTLWGWSDAGTTVAISDCLDLSSTTHCIGNGYGTITVQNTYYTNPVKQTVGGRPWSAELQGTRAYSSASMPSNIGADGKKYGLVQSYANGLSFDEKYYTEWASNPQPVNITFTKDGYSTYYDIQYDMVLTAGMKARIVTAKDGGNTLTYKTIADGDLNDAATNVVPAGTAVLLQIAPANDAQSIDVTMTAPTAEAIGQDNLLHGSDVATTTTGGDLFYKLSYNRDGAEKLIGWYWGAQDAGAFTSGAHKAWLALPSNGQHAQLRSIGLPGFYDGTTDVTVIPYQKIRQEDVWYDIYGRKLDDVPTQKGIYISNGRTIMIE